MATIEVTKGEVWTMFRVFGDVTRGDLLGAINNRYQQLESQHVIWDFSNASVIKITRADFEAIAAASREKNSNRPFGKTAIVSTTPEAFALTCMYSSVAVMADNTVDYYVFRTIEEAKRWVAQTGRSLPEDSKNASSAPAA